MTMPKPIVLVLCTGNSCRSQMAEGFLRKYHGDLYDIHSAGMEPKEQVHPLAVRVMAEVGIDLSGLKPKDTRHFLGHLPVKHLMIVCDRANQSCPRIWPGVFTRAYLPFDDPTGVEGTEDEKLSVFRQVRDQIDKAMNQWNPQLDKPDT
jgi:arsenate reductase (thioredoxin)